MTTRLQTPDSRIVWPPRYAPASALAGVSTDVCLALPAVSAVRDGYDVYAVIDASGTFSQHALMASMFRMSQAGVVIANATMLVSELFADWSSRYAEPIGKILGARVPGFGFVAAGFNHRPAKVAPDTCSQETQARLKEMTA